ncbi:S53 family peptidase [Amycolatopsis vancoresmycina]|uniref:Serine protease n=1 Tax=Amycolatopsis vancoresmycina DSM 44592 TaxID=1292037 RepID=R1HCR9_9PSEU|nr:S53 family peptidase [Amycolatopsis vancoresmycina]EOD58251.1 serine protease [Amycolatopsis vancoresmycina DSM 44592]
MRRPRAGIILLASLLIVPAAPSFAAEPPRVPVRGLDGTRSAHVVQDGTDAGPADPAGQVTAQVFLDGDSRRLAGYARAVSDPRDPRYGHFLSPEQTRARFGPSQDRIDAVSAWLRGSGLSIVSAGSRAVVAQGTVAAAAEAFGTRFHNYTYYGTPFRAAVDPVTVPAAVGPDVLTVTGLTAATGSRPPVPPPGTGSRTAARAAVPVSPCPDHYGDTPATDLPAAYGRPAQWAPCGYTPRQVRDAYGITGTGLTGKGVTIGIISIGNEINTLPDANRFAAEHGEPPFAPGQFTAHVPPGTRPEEASGEFAMDVQAAHAMAPGADIAFVVGSRARYGDDVLDSIVQIVDRHLADVVSGSIIVGSTPGYAPDAVAAYERAFQEAAVEGITFTFASGDSGGGSTDSGGRSVEYPASSPWVTAVGGTTLAIGPGNSYLWEIGWATDEASLSGDGRSWDPGLPGYQGKASGGGTSTVFPQPFYQRGVVPASFAGSPPMRTLPDVAALADPDLCLLVGETGYDLDGSLSYKVGNGGGTSLSSPAFAGVAALLVQEHGPLGFANPALYARPLPMYHAIRDNPAGTPDTVAFAVERRGFVDLITPGQYADSNLVHAPGYDTVTGLGSPTRRLIDSFRRRP